MSDFYSSIIGQDQALVELRAAAERPVHAYMFVGPRGCGKDEAALSFAAALLDDERALRGVHPDVVSFEREGASISVGQAREIARVATRSPVEGERKVLILEELHLVDEAAPALLKTIEEAPASTVFIVLADRIPKELTTVASRCVKVEFCPLSTHVIAELLAAEGVSGDRATEAADSAFGDLERARLLASDEMAGKRHQLWEEAVSRLDGSGYAVARLVDEIVTAVDEASSTLGARQVAEKEAMAKAAKEGVVQQSAKMVEARHKRELRRLRTDELRSGLAVLAQVQSAKMAAAQNRNEMDQATEALAAIQWASESIAFNPNEVLLLQGLFTRMSQTPAPAAAAGR